MLIQNGIPMSSYRAEADEASEPEKCSARKISVQKCPPEHTSLPSLLECRFSVLEAEQVWILK